MYFCAMIEKIIMLDGIDPVIFFGINNANMQLIKTLYPKLRIVARGNVLKVIGDELELVDFEEKVQKLEAYCTKYNQLTNEAIINIIKEGKDGASDQPQQENLSQLAQCLRDSLSGHDIRAQKNAEQVRFRSVSICPSRYFC